MKKLLLGTLLVMASMATTLAHNALEDVYVSTAVKKAFLAEFGVVYQVSWQKAEKGMLRADFVLDGQAVSAFFDGSGQLEATTMQKQFKDLPRRLQSRIQATFGDQRPIEVFELIHEHEQAFFFVMQVSGQQTIYRGYGSGHFKRHLVG